MTDQKTLDALANMNYGSHITFLLSELGDDGKMSYGVFNYERDEVNMIIKMLEYVGDYFYHHDGTMFHALTDMERYDAVVMEDFKKVMLIKNMKMLFEKFIIEIKNNKLEFGIVSHNKTLRTILSSILNVPLRKDIKLYKETPSGLTSELFNREDPYCIRYSEDLIKMLNGNPSANMKRRINLIKVREELKVYAKSKGMNTDGVFSKLPQLKGNK